MSPQQSCLDCTGDHPAAPPLFLQTWDLFCKAVGGIKAFKQDDDGNYIFDYAPIVWAIDVASHLR